MLEFFLLGCTGVVMFLHGANFFFHALSSHLAIRAISFLGFVSWGLFLGKGKQKLAVLKSPWGRGEACTETTYSL